MYISILYKAAKNSYQKLYYQVSLNDLVLLSYVSDTPSDIILISTSIIVKLPIVIF